MAGKHSKTIWQSLGSIDLKSYGYKSTAMQGLPLTFKIIIAVLIISLLLSSIWTVSFFMAGKHNQTVINRSKQVFELNGSAETIKMLSGNNKDIKGWLRIWGTDIDNVVCHTDNNSYYINHNQEGKKSRYGALFLSYEDTFNRAGGDKNIVIFGNNMKDGSMFGSLKKYRNINFYKQNPFVELFYADRYEQYVVFSVMLISASKDDNNTSYNSAKSYFVDDSEFGRWFDETKQRSLINTNIEVKNGDNILTLVTVANDFDGARLVVSAKKIEDAENIDTSAATVNAKIKYPKIWYTTKGMEYPY